MGSWVCSGSARQVLFPFLVCLVAGVAVGSSSDGAHTQFAFSTSLPQNFSRNNIFCSGNSSLADAPQFDPSICLTPTAADINKISQSVAGRCMYNQYIDFSNGSSSSGNSGTEAFGVSFSTMFSFNFALTAPINSPPGEGFAFIITADGNYAPTGKAEGGGYLGWLNQTTEGLNSGHNFAVEFDIHQNPEFQDPKDDHVGVNLNSMISNVTAVVPSGMTSDDNSVSWYAWIDYNATLLTVRLSQKPAKPCDPLISKTYDLSRFLQQKMYVGFSSASGNTTSAQPTIFAWSFNSGGTPENLWPGTGNEKCGSKLSWYFIVIISVVCVLVVLALVLLVIVCVCLPRWNAPANRVDILLGNPGYVCQRFEYKELSMATKGFSTERELGKGGSGVVYLGKISRPNNQFSVAVKRIVSTSTQGEKEFVAEVMVIGRLGHVNLVKLLGWCHDRGELLLVYDYMPNGSLYDLLYPETDKLSPKQSRKCPFELRLQILDGVAAALVFLHEGWDQRVVHRDVKSSNVLLDNDFKARLGDFGLARLYDLNKTHHSTNVAGTIGYMAPECIVTGAATEKSDVYSFGALVLEVATGKKPADRRLPGEEGLVKWVWRLYHDDSVLEAVDPALAADGYDAQQMEVILTVGLSCCNLDPGARPTMRQVESVFKGENTISSLPPVSSSGWSLGNRSSSVENDDTALIGTSQQTVVSVVSMPSLRSRNSFKEGSTHDTMHSV